MFGLKKTQTGIYIGRKTIAAVEVARDKGVWSLKRHFTGPIPDERSLAALTGSFKRMISSSGIKAGKVALSIPDTLVDTVFMDIKELPRDNDEAYEIVRWKAAKGFNRSPKGLRVGYQAFEENGKVRILVAAINKETVLMYEDALSAIGMRAERINIHSFNLDNLLAERVAPSGNFSVVSAMDRFVSVMIFKNGIPDFYRCKSVEGREEEISKELGVSFLFYRGKNPDIVLDRIYFFDGQDGIEEAIGKMSFAQAERIKGESLVRLNGITLPHRADISGLLAALGAVAGI